MTRQVAVVHEVPETFNVCHAYLYWTVLPFRGASDERDALSRASSCARLSGSGSIESCSYIARTTLPTPSITPLRKRSRSVESLIATPLASPLRPENDLAGSPVPPLGGQGSREHFSRGFTLEYVLPHNLWISESSREIVFSFK